MKLVTGGVYVALFVLGVVEGAIGSFQYSRTAGGVPLAALAFCVVILVTCLLAGWSLGAVSGALVPAAGWVLTSFALSMPVSNGSVVISGTAPGEWYLYGGTVSVTVAVVLSFGGWIRAQAK